MIKNIIVLFLIVNALFWGLFPHSFHCQLVARFTDRPCPPHIVHLAFGIICFVMAVVLSQEEYVVEMTNATSNFINTTSRIVQSGGKLLSHFYNKFDGVDHFESAVNNLVKDNNAFKSLNKYLK